MSADSSQPYQTLAGIYDYVMRHVDYDEWAGYVIELLTRFGHQPQSLVELACGTGNMALELAARGVPVRVGADAAGEMLRVAREKAGLAGSDIRFVEADLRRLAEPGELGELGPFDTAVCMYDSLNYLLSLDEVAEALRGVHALLEPGGLFVFDVCTEENSLRYFRDGREREIGPGFAYERHSYYQPDERLQVNDFSIRFEGRAGAIEEHHVQRIYPLTDLLGAVRAAPFELLGAFDGFTFGRGTEHSDRVHVALRRLADGT